MKIEAHAKVNLSLEVFGKRVDGYHALRSVVVPVSLADVIEIEPSATVSSDTGYADDLCVRAALALREACGVRGGASMRVEKRIPVGGGLGGGSADAAAVLWALNGMWDLSLPPERLAEIGAGVGSDVPALVLSRVCGPVLMEGRGERVRPLFDAGERAAGMPRGFTAVLVNPGVFSSTAEVYSGCEPRVTNDASILYNIRNALASGDVAALSASLVNDLERPAERLHPEIAAAKRELLACGAAGALVSGSGSTVFGLVPDEARGRETAALLGAKGYAAWCVAAECPVV